MSYKSIILLASFICISVGIFAQPTVSGTVVDEEGYPLPGTTIVELGTENETISDLKGNFTLSCKSSFPTIAFQFVGMVDQRLSPGVNSVVHVIMKYDTTILKSLQSTFYCFSEVRVTEVGVNSGLQHNPLGIEIRNHLPYFASLRLDLNADFKWRFIKDQDYLNVRLRRSDIFRIGYVLDFGLRAEFKEVERLFKQYAISTEVNFRGYQFAVGYAVRDDVYLPERQTYSKGLNLELQKTYFRNLSLRLGTIYWRDNWQYLINLTERIPGTSFRLSCGWEKMDDWQEFDVSLLYRLQY